MRKYTFSPEQQFFMEESAMPFAMYQLVDKRVVALVVTNGFCEMFGLRSRAEAYELMNTDMYRDVHPDDVARIGDIALQFASSENMEYDAVFRSKSYGGYRIIHAQGRHIYPDPNVRLAVVWYTDEGLWQDKQEKNNNGVKEPSRGLSGILTGIHSNHLDAGRSEFEREGRKMLQESMGEQILEASEQRKMAYDFLTGLPGMTYFFELAESGKARMLEAGLSPVMLYMDFSGMKYYNRKYGFQEGDKLLKAFSKVLVKHFTAENCGRMAQDHFAAYTDAAGLEQKLRMIIAEVKGLNDGKSLPLRIGIYADRMGPADPATACDRAKYACDMKKESYYSHYSYFSESMLKESSDRQYIVENIDRAIEEGWIKVFYQPIIRAANGRVCDEEALARWIDPVKGFMSPADFIPTLEEARLIYKLDLYVVDSILKKMKEQAEEGLYVVPTSVNLSRHDFETCDIVEEIRERVDRSGISRDKLTIEITESVIGTDFDFMKGEIDRFRELGFKIWMDDFGSGYSSLDVLQSISFDLIKLDMRFMQQFEQGEKCKIILTELIRMAMGLGIDTVAEGVETAEQAEFLREVGCTKLQGYYYCKPIPMTDILERYRKGTQIGFENPDESEYYSALGRISLYDLSVTTNEYKESFRNFFDTVPMAIMEIKDDEMVTLRCNASYREFMHRAEKNGEPGAIRRLSELKKHSYPYYRAIQKCRGVYRKNDNDPEEESLVFFDDVNEWYTIHAFVRKISDNPVNGKQAIATVILEARDRDDRTVTYAHIAQALSADYYYLYYVNLNNESFIEFRSDPEKGDLVVERRGEDFFRASRTDAVEFIYEDDRKDFIEAFTRENVLNAMSKHGSFTLSYRLLVEGKPMYVNMKAVRMGSVDEHIIIGVNNVDAQMRQQEALERIRQEQTTYQRITALSGNYICIYTVDPETDRYTEYSATDEYRGLGLAKSGEDFFNQAQKEGERVIYPEDLDMFRTLFVKEKVMEEIRANGLFQMNYRMVMDGVPTYIRLKAALVEEKDGPQLVIGVINVDAQVRRDQAYADLLAAGDKGSGS